MYIHKVNNTLAHTSSHTYTCIHTSRAIGYNDWTIKRVRFSDLRF